jgi:hypothetical protein
MALLFLKWQPAKVKNQMKVEFLRVSLLKICHNGLVRVGKESKIYVSASFPIRPWLQANKNAKSFDFQTAKTAEGKKIIEDKHRAEAKALNQTMIYKF